MAFLLPRGAPDPGAPPCIRQRRLPLTAGDLHGLPERVLAPQRGLDSIALVLRRCLLIICMAAPLRNRFTLPFADDLHSGLPSIGKSGRCIRSLLRKNIA